MKSTRKGFEGAILGTARLTVSADDFVKLLNILLGLGESYRNIDVGESLASVELSYPSAIKTVKSCSVNGLKVKMELCFGIPHIFKMLLKRWGIIAGIVAAIFIICLSESVIWEVRVECNGELSENDVKKVLAEHGVYPGAWKEGLDIDHIQNDIESERQDIAWISVNVIGTVAYIELIEEVIPPSVEVYDGVNLVAASDGVITGFEVITGMTVTEIGQTVKKGELLVSGLYDSERFGFRSVEAGGSVFARTEESFEVEIPLEYTVRTAKRREITEISLIFFNFRQKIFKKGGFSGINYDIIYSDIYIYSRDGITVPVGLSVGCRNIYTETAVKRSLNEAVDLAYFEINRQILAAISDAEVLSKSFIGEQTDEGVYRLICRVSCIRDIAEAKPFNVNFSE